jgi:hypothetical protein
MFQNLRKSAVCVPAHNRIMRTNDAWVVLVTLACHKSRVHNVGIARGTEAATGSTWFSVVCMRNAHLTMHIN